MATKKTKTTKKSGDETITIEVTGNNSHLVLTTTQQKFDRVGEALDSWSRDLVLLLVKLMEQLGHPAASPVSSFFALPPPPPRPRAVENNDNDNDNGNDNKPPKNAA